MYLRKCQQSVVGLFIFAVVFLVLTGGVARAEYPEKPITLIVPWPPGGASDVTPRSLLKTMSEELKQPVVIVNRPGAAGVVGTLEMERAVPDGYTIGTYSYSQTLTNFTDSEPPQSGQCRSHREGDVLPGHVDRERQFPREHPG